MTVYRRRLICFALVLSMLLVLIPQVQGTRTSALADTRRMGITLDSVNVRYGASTKAKIIFTLPASHVCQILEEKTAEQIHWYKVETTDPSRHNNNTYIGYINGDYFREMTAEEINTYNNNGTVATPTPIPDSSNGQPTPTPTPVPSGQVQELTAIPGSIGVVTAGGTNLREGPGTGYRSIEKLDRNTQVEILTIPSVIGVGAGTFFKVRYNQNVGYIMCDFISIISGGVQNGSSTTVTPVTPTATPSSGNNGSGQNTSGFTHVKLILSSCHLRVSPGGDYDSENDWEGQGSVLPLAGNPVQQGGYTWYPVSRNGKVYYVRNDCVQPFSDGSASNPTPTPTPYNNNPDITPTPATVVTATPQPTYSGNPLGWVKTIKGGCNLRATIGGTVIKQIAKNVTLPYLLEPVQKNGYTWYFVQDGSNRGYLRGDLVRVVSAPAQTPTPTPGSDPVYTSTPAPEDSPTGYLKTISSGVNLRIKAGYTDVIGQVARNVVMPYYGAPTNVKGVDWYYVKHPSLGLGYLHGSYIALCNSDGTDIPTPTPAPGVTTSPGSSGNSQQEASYTTLRLGSTGTAVKNLVTELKNQGYYNGAVTNKYTTAVEAAVKAFQQANNLPVDGIAGPATQHKLYGTVPIGSADTSNLSMTIYPAEKIDWYTGGINELWPRGSNYKIYDVKTGIIWWAHRWAGGKHVDAEPLTAADTARLCKIYGVSSSSQITASTHYQRRPCLVTIGTRTFACSLYGVPHNYPEGDTISNNDFKGQLCIHFTNSKIHDSNRVDSGHQEAIQYAWEHAPNGHK